ncbi:receptor-type tyrosine-protein phosphatase U [Sarotherodon galilaeus]
MGHLAEGKPHLCLFALKEIAAGSEITYDYGGKEWPWRKKLKIASIPSGQQCVAEPIAHDVEHHVISTDSFTDRELRAECQSSRPTADNSEHEVHSVGGQCGTSSLKELIGEVGVQYQELSPQAFSEELTSESKSKEVPQSSRAVPNDSACECTIHRLVFESVKLDKCGICHSPLTAIRWHGLRCKQCRCVWHKICLQTSSEDWDMSDNTSQILHQIQKAQEQSCLLSYLDHQKTPMLLACLIYALLLLKKNRPWMLRTTLSTF